MTTVDFSCVSAPRTEYTLTPLGEGLIETYRAVQDWAEAHVSEVLANRETYDRTQGR
ncbi:hypothetical protein [Embleya sp. AB8]|uniref:hypothetical protein n=1 Tax=Embleya sp. AB8 TaxID=3156304 RepID=UPI003C71FFB6